MLREIVYDLYNRMPDDDKTKVVLVLMGISINVDLIYRFEPEYVVCRGRESGTNDDNRGFFIPYGEIMYMKLERVITLSDLQGLYGDKQTAVADDPLAFTAKVGGEPTKAEPMRPAAQQPPPPPVLDPAAIAKQNLLDRIRAARTSAGSGGKPTFR